MRVFSAADLGSIVRNRRKELGYTQKELAGYCMCGTRFISEFENGKDTVQFEKAFVVLSMLGLNLLVEPRG